MIKHEEVRKIILFVPEDEIILQQYITEQQKKDKLLKLYRKYSKGLSSGRLNLQQLYDLQEQIKALEEELK